MESAEMWDGLAQKNWMRARKRKSTLEEKYKFVTFLLDRMTLSIEHKDKK